MSTTVEKLDEFTKNTQKALETLSKNNEGAGDRASKMAEFREHGLSPALALADQYTNEFASTISGPGGSKNTGSTRTE